MLAGPGVGLALKLLALAYRPDPVVEMIFTALAAYGSFFLAEHFHWLGCAGIAYRRPDDRKLSGVCSPRGPAGASGWNFFGSASSLSSTP